MTEQITETETDETEQEVTAPEVEPEETEPEAEETSEEEPETFPLAYVQQLRQEAADARVRVKDRDDLAARLHTALTSATGRLADPDDLPFDEAHLTDEAALSTAIDALLTRKPHLAARRVSGDVGQGATSSAATVDLAGMLRRAAS